MFQAARDDFAMRVNIMKMWYGLVKHERDVGGDYMWSCVAKYRETALTGDAASERAPMAFLLDRTRSH